ncbi:MAG: Type 1 glutamine amidotransferase-like domain-containing protein [Desulfobacterales bacterium]|nr:Type 1 glutamine amidotransferase-like domain-containing protein [Desulfobacterales bacterium]
MGGTRVLNAIQERLKSGALIAGTSAGAAVFSDTMIYEGKTEEKLPCVMEQEIEPPSKSLTMARPCLWYTIISC